MDCGSVADCDNPNSHAGVVSYLHWNLLSGVAGVSWVDWRDLCSDLLILYIDFKLFNFVWFCFR
uniref:Uncharacterized protein n=1 Tax=Helianthus annuus TaxID=4232 RepID=A0A251TT71_HELAN